MVDGEQGAKAEPVKVAAHAAPVPWYRRPRNLAVLGLVVAAVGAGGFVVAKRDSGPPPPGSSVAGPGRTGPNKTIADYLADNDLTMTPVRVGEPGTPVVTLPMPPGWSDAGPDTPPGVYGEMLYDNATNPDDAPFIDILLSRLDGDADPAQVLEYATGELKNLPDYIPGADSKTSQLSGFAAVQLAGLYTKNGEQRIIAQKTVLIPSPNGLFVLQMNANAPKADASILQQATALIDEQAKITP